MDLIKQYLVQSISSASNNLRLSTQQIEVVALLRESILKSDELESNIKKMKKITELSTFAIRLNEIYSYLTQEYVDLLRISDKFKEHSRNLVKDLNNLLGTLNPSTFKQALNKLDENIEDEKFSLEEEKIENSIDVDLSRRTGDNSVFENTNELTKERFILEEDNTQEELTFEKYEDFILKPVKPLDALLKQIKPGQELPAELNEFTGVMKNNASLSLKIGFEILANMHTIVAESLQLIISGKLSPVKEVIESLRACLIVIVAVVRGKEVDITNYLNRAEDFGRKIQSLIKKES
jgi:hypothetical protein